MKGGVFIESPDPFVKRERTEHRLDNQRHVRFYLFLTMSNHTLVDEILIGAYVYRLIIKSILPPSLHRCFCVSGVPTKTKNRKKEKKNIVE